MKNVQTGLDKNIHWLKKHDSIDREGEYALKKSLKKAKNILVIGQQNAGKDTVKNIILTYLYEHNHSPVVLPSLNVGPLASFFKSAQWKKYTKILNQNFPTLFAFSHKTNNPIVVDKLLPKFVNNFDLLVDCRTLPNGQRVIVQILQKSGKSWKALYFSEKYFLKQSYKILAA